jgi:hypothetical protein
MVMVLIFGVGQHPPDFGLTQRMICFLLAWCSSFQNNRQRQIRTLETLLNNMFMTH